MKYFQHENYRVFHTTKEIKRNNLENGEWARLMGAPLITKIKEARSYEEVSFRINSLLQKIHKRYYPALQMYDVWLRNEDNIPKDYQVKAVAVAPSGFVTLHEPRDTILVKANLSKENFLKEVFSNTFRLNYWNKQRNIDFHQLFHVWFYHCWRSEYHQSLDRTNFDQNLLSLLEVCETELEQKLGGLKL